jgi:histidyl-tRNA synthetase
MRTFDSKEQETIAVMKEAPLITEFLCDECRDHFEGARGYLDDLEVGYVIDAKLVRGLDYYTRTAFEFKASDLGSQDTVLAGGRYDGLSESLGGPPLPGIGFASGLERLMLSGSKGDETKTFIDAYVVAVGDGVTTEAMKLATRLRRKGFGVDIDLLGRSMKGQMKDAARSGARWALVLGEDEVKAGEVALRDMTTATQERIPIGDVERRLSR